MPEYIPDIRGADEHLRKMIPDMPDPFPIPNMGGTIPNFPHAFPNLQSNGVQEGMAFDEIFRNIMNAAPASKGAPIIPLSSIYTGGRYDWTRPGTNYEEMHAQQQSTWDRAANGILKGTNLAATTIAGGFAMLGGAAQSMFTGRLADIWDNGALRSLDKWNDKVDQEFLPNYYTEAEKNAEWYSTTNWFTANFLFDKLIKNSGFAVGAMLSGNIANVGLLRAGAGIGKLAMAGASAAEASQAFKLFTPLLRNTARAFSNGKNIEAAAILEKQISSIADLTANSSKLGELAKQSFSEFGNLGRRTAIAAYSSGGESAFEALSTAKEYRNNLIEKYKTIHGEDPSGDALDQINKESESVGKTSFFGNMALLSITEYVQLPYLMGSSYRNSRNTANSLIGKSDDVLLKESKYIAPPKSTTKFGKLYDKVTGIGRYVFDPKEAGQEIGQYALQIGTQNYFNKARETKDADYWTDGFLYGFTGRDDKGIGKGAFVSKEGMESLILGGITGGLMQAKGKFQEAISTKSNTQKFLTELNNAPSFRASFKDRLNSANRGIVLQEQHESAVILGDELEAKDLKTDQSHNYLTSRIKYGRFDMVMDDINELRTEGMTEEGLASLKVQGMANINDTVEEYQKRLTTFEKTAKYTNELYKSLNLRYSGEQNKDGSRKYSSQVIDKMVYAASKIADYDLRIPQVATSLISAGVGVGDILESIIIKGEPSNEAIKKGADVIAAIKGVEDVNDALTEDLRDVVELSMRRALFIKEYNNLKNGPQKYNEKEIEEEIEGEQKQTIKITTEDGEEDVEIGTEYYLGNVIGYDKSGKEVIRFPKITILGENEDGTIKIKGSNGIVRDISKKELADYKLGKVSDTLNNKKAKFFMEHINTIFEFNFGKGAKMKGRLKYSHKKGVLEFIYKDKKGKIKVIEVTGDQFVVKKGYKEALIVAVGELTEAQQKSLEEYAKEKDERITKKRESRLKILNELFENVSSKITTTETLLKQKYSDLEKIVTDLSLLESKIKTGGVTKRHNFKSTTNKAIKAANKLSRMQEQLRLEIQELEAEKEQLEINLAYISDMGQNIDELPTDSGDFLEEIKEQKGNLESLLLETGININSISSLIDNVDKALNSAIALVRDLVEKFESTYPKVPTIMGRPFNDFIQANPNFLKINPSFRDDLERVEDAIAQIEDLDIIPNERTVVELKERIEELQKQLQEIEKQLIAKSLIVDKFEEIVKRFQKQKKEEETAKRDGKLIASVLGTADKAQQILAVAGTYEPEKKKEDRAVVASTMAPNEGKPHQERANTFGANLDKFSNRKNIRGVYVSVETESMLGLTGLMAHIKGSSEADVSKTIALVMVEEDSKDGTLHLVGEDGNRLKTPTLDNVIYQVFPLENLEWDAKYSKTPGKKVSMFRENTPTETIDALKEQYKAWRNETLESRELVPHEIVASFGIPEYLTEMDEKGNESPVYSTQTPVEDAGLIDANDLNTTILITIPTVETSLSRGSTTFKSPQGLPFLALPNGYVKLNNRKLLKNEARTIYQVIQRVVDNIYRDNDAQGDETQELLSWLKSVIYWGTPKDVEGNRKPAGYNSIWFENTADGLALFISGKAQRIPFTPSSIRDNEEKITTLLENMYNNINATKVNGGKTIEWNSLYREIVSISRDGKIVYREWKNYQTFLLSSVLPDGTQRKSEEIPLSTAIRPLKNKEDVNRKGIYFIVPDVAEGFVIPKPVVKKATIITPVASKKVVPKTFVLDGKTKNTFVSSSGLKILFIGNSKLLSTISPEKAMVDTNALTVVPGEDLNDALVILLEKTGDIEKAKFQIKLQIYNAVLPQINKKETIDDVEKTEEKQGTFPDTQISIELTEEEKKLFNEQASSKPTRNNLRVKLEEASKRFEGEDWEKVEVWLKANFPNIPVYRIKNILKGTNGIEAWGMLKDGAIYVYENAETGTIYHEVFEAVWKMFADENERNGVVAEFKNRKGSFVDRPTGKTVNYSEASDREIKEQLAEEFRDYILYKKIPPKPIDGRPFIVKLFSDLINLIKAFFVGKNAVTNTEALFKKIGTGYYKQYSPQRSALAFAAKGFLYKENELITDDSDLRLKDVRGEQENDIIQYMNYLTLRKITDNNESLFKDININKKDLYDSLKENVQTAIAQIAGVLQDKVNNKELTIKQAQSGISNARTLWKNVGDQWETIISKHQDQLRAYNIEFDENDEASMTDENNSGKEDYIDASKIDGFRKANGAIKLLLSTLPIVNRLKNGQIEAVPSSINGIRLIPTLEAWMTVMNAVKQSRNNDEMLENIRILANKNINYISLYKRLSKNQNINEKANLSLSLTEMHDIQLLSTFWKSFKKQVPDVKNIYIDEGKVVIGDANFTSAAKQIGEQFDNSIINSIKNDSSPYFKYSIKDGAYFGVRGAVKQHYNLDDRIAFLKTLGINFTRKEIKSLSVNEESVFNIATDGIRKSINDAEKLVSVGGKFFKIKGRLRELSEIKAKLENPEFSSTYYNVNGERVQSFIGPNANSDLYDMLSQINNISELVGSQYEYLLTDSFSQNSVLLNKMFDSLTGKRISGSENLMTTAYSDGIIDMTKGTRKQSSKLTYKQRLIQEINLNLDGYYLNLVPGDASIGWSTYMGNAISAISLRVGYGEVHKIFKGYFFSELALSREARPIKHGNTKDLRFLLPILGKELHDKIINKKGEIEEIYNEYENQINNAIERFIKNETAEFRKILEEYSIIKQSTNDNNDLLEKWNIENINVSEDLSESDLNRELSSLSINFMINNIELHKLLYSDPYQYNDELKRIKSFSSPRNAIIHSSPDMNAAINNIVNKGYEKGDIGYTDMNKDFFVTSTVGDVKAILALGKESIGKDVDESWDESWDETDGAGMISMKANRAFRIRAGNWNAANESQYRYDVAYEKNIKKLPLSKEEGILLQKGNPRVTSTYTPIKPIVSGNKANEKEYNDVVLDKFALFPLSFRILHELNPESNAIKLYNKMQKEGIDYVVYNSARKVGSEKVNALYNNGKFNFSKYEGNINVPFAIISVQAEIPSKRGYDVTRGSQITNLATMDFMEAGVPVDFMKSVVGRETTFPERYDAWLSLEQSEKLDLSPLYKEIKNNQDLLESMMEEAYNSLLKRFDIEKTDEGFKIKSFSKTVKLLREEILKQQINDNITEALLEFEDGKVVIEATPAYKQVVNILYSIADKMVVSPKISGSQKVQLPSTLLESVRGEEITINGKTGYASDILDFYVDDNGKRVAEVMVARWFKSKLSDKELLKYLNDTAEGQKILSGVAFRIPTQKQNSIDVFKIKQFLPKEFGDSVIIPSALVKKVGSDFDIDKLFMYLKNVYIDGNGFPKLIPFFGHGIDPDKTHDAATQKIYYDKKSQEGKDKIKEFLVKEDLEYAISFGEDREIGDEIEDNYDTLANRVYKKSLENEYIQSLQNLISSAENFQRLVRPNSPEQLKALSKKIQKKLGFKETDYSSTENMMSRGFMSKLRHAFVTGKYALGISNRSQINHSMNQRSLVHIDLAKLSGLSEVEKFWLGDGLIKFKEYNKIKIGNKNVATLSMIKNAAGEDMSNIISQFTDGYVDISKGPWVMDLGASPNVAPTFLFLVKIGVPINVVGYFMNQPIIKDYLRKIDDAGYSWLFISDFVEEIKSSPKYRTSNVVNRTKTIPSEKNLYITMGQESFTNDEKNEQQFILSEFLKYAKMANQLFLVTQATNLDTATLNDPYLIFKKEMQLINARNTIFSSPDDILNNSFLGKLRETQQNIVNGFSEIFISDQASMRSVMHKLLLPYINMSDRDFISISKRAVENVFDWAVQNDRGINKTITSILVSETESAAKEMATFVKEIGINHPLHNNQVIKSLAFKFNPKKGGGVNNVYINNKENKIYDQNQIIYAFSELKEYLNSVGNPALYGKLVRAAVLQSGLSNSPISFTHLLPYEEFKEIYNKTLSKIDKLDGVVLSDFNSLNVFERNNWADDEIVPRRRARWKEGMYGWKYNNNMKFFGNKKLTKAIEEGVVPAMLNLSSLAREASSDIIVYVWETGTKKEKQDKKKIGDFSYINKGLFKKVYVGGEPLSTEFTGKEGVVFKSYIYKAINAWGDSFRANEFYNIPKQSVIDNGFIKVDEKSDDFVASYFDKKTPSQIEGFVKPPIVPMC